MITQQRARPPFVVAVLCQKGGVGKTTLTSNLAAAAHLDGMRTLLLDQDRQASAFNWYAAREETSRLRGLACARADKALPLPKLRELFAGRDAVFIDGPPRLGDVTRAAAVAADVVLIPSRAGAFDWWALKETLEVLDGADEIREQLGREPVRRVLVLNGAPTQRERVRLAVEALAGAAPVAPVSIGNRVAFADASVRGESVLTLADDSKASEEIRALWRALRDEGEVAHAAE